MLFPILFVVACVVALGLGVALVVVIRSKQQALADAAATLAQTEGKVKDAEASAARWYVLSPVRWYIEAYLEALREYEIIADGGGDEDDYSPDRLAGEANDWEGQDVVKCETELLRAVVALRDHERNETAAIIIAIRLEEEMIGRSGGGYRHSLHRPLRESWNRLFDALVAPQS